MSQAGEEAATVRHAELWGPREIYETAPDGEKQLVGGKYHALYQSDVDSTNWQTLNPQSPFHLFVPQNTEFLKEYETGWKVTEMMPVNSVGIVTGRDKLAIHWNKESVQKMVKQLISLSLENVRENLGIERDTPNWKVSDVQDDLRQCGYKKSNLAPVLYRPFDRRWTYYTGRSGGFICRPRADVMRHMLAGENIGLLLPRQLVDGFRHVFCSTSIANFNAIDTAGRFGSGPFFPLYLYSKMASEASDLIEAADAKEAEENGVERWPNLAAEFVEDVARRLKLKFVPDGMGDLKRAFGPEDVFHYMYSVFHSPTYRERYAEFLKLDFPRLPLTKNRRLFRALCVLGERLKELHLMEADGAAIATYPETGDNTVEKVRYVAESTAGGGCATPAGGGCATHAGRVYINQTQYFGGVPGRVWEFHVGGYQVCHKWLKDRKGRQLSYDDLTHYQRIVAALDETIDRMAEIDAAIDNHGGWPLT